MRRYRFEKETKFDWIINYLIRIRGLNLLIKESEIGTDRWVYVKKGFSDESMNLITNPKSKYMNYRENRTCQRWRILSVELTVESKKISVGEKNLRNIWIYFLLNGRILVLEKNLILSKQAQNAGIYLSRKGCAKITFFRS